MTREMNECQFDQMEIVRESGETNMLDMIRVHQIAEVLGLDDLLLWFEGLSTEEYAETIFYGPRIRRSDGVLVDMKGEVIDESSPSDSPEVSS